MHAIGLFLASLLILFAETAQAVKVPDLFRVELPVDDQSETVKQQAFSQAMRQVLIKVSGSRQIIFEKALQRPIRNPNRYVQQLAYERREIKPESALNAKNSEQEDLVSVDPNALSSATDQLWLSVDFYPETIEKLLRENGLPVWGNERPATLLWMVQQDFSGARLVSSDDDPELVEQLTEAARQQGLPILFPLYDLEDTQLVNTRVVQQPQLDPLLTAAMRYSPEAMLVGDIQTTPAQQFSASWTLVFAERQTQWQDQASTLEQLLEQLMQRTATTLAQEYAVISEIGETSPAVALSVTGVNSVDQYLKVVRYLEQLQVVEQVQIRDIQADQLRLELQLRSGTADFDRLVKLGTVLEQLELPQLQAGPQQRVELFYTLQP